MATVLLLVLTGALGWGIGQFGPKVALAIPALLLGLAVLWRPVLGLYLVAFTVPFEAVVLIPGGATITKAMAVLVVLAWAFRKLLRRESWQAVLRSPVFVAGVAFLGFALLSRLWGTYVQGVTVQLARLFMMFGLCVLVMDLVRTWEQAAWLARFLVLGGLVAAGLTLWQSYGVGMRRAGEAVGGGVNATALALVCILPFAFALLRSQAQGRWWRLIGLLYVPVAGLAVIVTFSRMSFLVGSLLLVVEYGITLRSGQGRVPLLVLTGIALVAFVVFVPAEKLQERASTIAPYIRATFEGGGAGAIANTSGRGYHLRLAMAIFRDHPILGAGYWNFGQYSLQYQFDVPGSSDLLQTPRSTHSSFFRILADLGLVGMALWLTLLGFTGRELWIAWRETRRRGGPAFALVRAVTFLFVLEQVYGFYAELQVEKILWMTLGLAVAFGALTQAGARAPLGSEMSVPEAAEEGEVEARAAHVGGGERDPLAGGVPAGS